MASYEELYQNSDQVKIESNNGAPETSTAAVGTASNPGGKVGYNTIEYPNGMLGDPDGPWPHFMIFYINANSRGKIANIPGNTVKADLTKNTSGTGLTNVIRNSPTAKFVTEKLATVSETAGSVAGNFINPHKRLLTAICLPLPASIHSNSDAVYDVAEVGAVGSLITAFASGQIQGTFDVALSTLMRGAATGIASRFNLPTNNISAIVDKVRGALINKRQEQVFREMKIREYQFDFLLVPRNEQESNNIKEIIRLFRLHMHPEVDNLTSNNAMLLMPAEFDIEFRYKQGLNENIPKIATSGLKSVHVNYTPIGEFIAFEDTSNPVAISLSLLFEEMEPIFQNSVENGF